jgi:hypothetical protein
MEEATKDSEEPLLVRRATVPPGTLSKVLLNVRWALEIVAGPDCVVVLWSQKGRNPVSAEVFEMPVASVYRMKDGCIVDLRMFHFDAAASRDFLDRATRLASA